MEKQLINSPLSVLNKLGYLVGNSFKNRLLKTAMVLLFCFDVVVPSMQYFYPGSEIGEIIENTGFVCAATQVLCKILLTMFNGDKMLNLIKLSGHFWSSDKCTRSTKRKVDKILSTMVVVQKVFFYSLCVICVTYYTVMFVKGTQLPVGMWNMTEYTRLYRVAIPAYSLYISCACLFVYGFECMFLALCYELIVQFKILCDCLEMMDVEKIETENEVDFFYSRLNVYVDHHRFLRSFTKLYQDFYSSVFMVQYVTSAPLICIFFYASFTSSDTTLRLKCVFSCYIIIVQFAFYCIPLATLSHEVSSISTAVYNSNWYSKHHTKLKKSTLLIIQQAQQEIRFSALGLIYMNPQTLLNVLKTAFSTSMFLRSLDY